MEEGEGRMEKKRNKYRSGLREEEGGRGEDYNLQYPASDNFWPISVHKGCVLHV